MADPMISSGGGLVGGAFGGNVGGVSSTGEPPGGNLYSGGTPESSLYRGDPAPVRLDPTRFKFQRLIDKSRDQMTMNLSTAEDLDKDPEYINILGTVMKRSELEAMDGGKQILDLERRRRTGQRGFWEAAVKTGEGTFAGFEAADLPFAGDVIGMAIPIKEMRKVRSTLEKLDRGDYVDPQDKVYARLYLADAERKSQQGFYGKLGDVVHGLPTLGAEMWLTSQAFAAAAAPFAGGAAATGVGAPAAAATEAAAGLAGALTALGKTGFKAAARAEARKAAGEWIKACVKKSYLDLIPKVVGPDAAKLGWGAATLRGMGEMAITAPIKGAGYAGVDILANAAVNTAMGEDALSSRNEIEKQIAGYMDNNDELTKNARWLALGDKFVEYYTEMAGEGLGELIGLPIKGVARAGFNKIPAMEKYRKTLETVWGSPAELAERQKKFGAMTPADRSKEISALGMWGLNKMVDHNINPSKVVDFLKDTGYHGWIGEMAEERYAGFLNGLYGSDDGKGDLESAMKNMWPDKDQLMAEAIGFMIPIATLHATARMQNMKALGGKGMFNSSNWAEGAKATSRVIGASGPVVEIHGQREAAETPEGAPAEPVIPADPSAPTDTGAPPTTGGKDDFQTSVDFLMENSESDRTVANTKSSVLQRLAKGALRIANVAVTGDFGRMQAGDSVSRYLQDFGINEPFARKMSSFEDEVAKATRDRRIAEATSGGKTLSDEEIKSERFDFELIRASKEVQDAKREYTELLLSAVAAKNGRIALQESRFAEAAKRANVSPEELEKRLRNDVAAGRIAVMSHGDGNKSIIRRTMEGKDATEEVQRGIETALDEVLGPTRAMQQLHTEALNTIEESVGGMSLNDKMLNGDQDELTKLAIHSARPISRTTQLHDFVKTTTTLARSEASAARVRVSHTQRGIQGDVWVRIGEDGKAHVHPFKQRAEDIAAADYIRKDKKFAEQIDLASMNAQLGSMGLAPQIVPTEIKFIRPTSFINDDIVRLVRALGYDSREEFSDDNKMEEYLRMKTLAEHGPAEQRETARKYVAARWKMAEDSYANQYGGNIENLKAKVDGKEVYKFTVGAFNVPGTVFVVVPPDTGARTSTTSVVEDILEERLKRAYYADDKHAKYRNYHIKYLEKLQNLAVRLSGNYEKPYPKVAKELKAIANLLSAVVLPEKKISYDSLSKPITMLFGHFDASTTSGEGILQASGWSALRQAIMEDAGTEAEPGMRTLTAGFLSKILQDTMGQAGLKNFQDIPAAFFPSGMVKGYETSNRSLFQGKTLAPLRDLETLNTLRKTGEAALDDTVKKALSPDGQDLKESSTGVVPAQAEKDKSKSEKAKADKERAEADAAAAAPGDPVADAGYPNEVAAKLAYATEKFEEETYEDFLTRKMCMGNTGPYSGGAPTGKPASIRRPKKK